MPIPDGIMYGPSVLSITIHHKNLVVGCVHISLAVFGWLLSEFPCYDRGNEHLVLTLKFKTLGKCKTGKFDPMFLGARTQVIISGLKKEIK